MSRSNKSRYGRRCKKTKGTVGLSACRSASKAKEKKLENHAQKRAAARELPQVVEEQRDATEHAQGLLYED